MKANLAQVVGTICITAAPLLHVLPASAEETKKDWTIAGNVGATTDYVFRGVSQSAEKPAVQANIDVAYKQFYAGIFFSNVDFVGQAPGPGVGVAEVDYYAGV